MMRCLREVNVDNNTVGWYQSTYMGSFQTVELIETFMNYQENIQRCVCIIYDPLALKVINTEWGSSWSNNLPRADVDESLDAESINPGDQFFEKMVSGMYLGEILRRVLLKMGREAHLFVEKVPSKLLTPYTLSTPKMCSRTKWKRIIGEIDVLEDSLKDMKGRSDVSEDKPPAPTSDRKSLLRSPDERLYLIVQGEPYNAQKGEPVWHFPEKIHSEETNLRKCAESALEALIGDIGEVYFSGNAPSGHLEFPDFKRFYFRSHFVGKQQKAPGAPYKDYVWVSRDELSEYIIDQTHLDLLKRMLPSF